jgi:NADH-quinone oxidoreductase subunit N
VTVAIFVAVLALLALAADLVPGGGSGRGIGALVAAGLLGILAATWFVPGSGESFGGAFVDDAFTCFVQRVLLVAGIIGTLGSIEHADRVFPKRQGEYYLLLLASLCGMTLIAGARDLVLLVVSFELMGIPLYVLAAMHKTVKEGIEGATKLYLTGATSAAVTVYGLSFLIGAVGSTGFDALTAAPSTPMLALGALLVLAGMAYKVGAVPFHMWVPDTYQAAPTPFVAFLSVAPKVAGFAAFARLFLQAMSPDRTAPMMLLLGVLTMIAGNLFALPQTQVRRLLGYSGVAHVGLLLVALSIGTVDALGGMLFYLATYVASNMGAFLVVEVVGEDAIPAWNGLARRSPALALSMLLFLLSLGGIPFVAGFWAKLIVFYAAWTAGLGGIVLLGALLAVLGLFYYLKVARAIYMEPSARPEGPVIGRATAFAIGIAVAGVVGMGLYPAPFLDSALEAASVIVPAPVVTSMPLTPTVP